MNVTRIGRGCHKKHIHYKILLTLPPEIQLMLPEHGKAKELRALILDGLKYRGMDVAEEPQPRTAYIIRKEKSDIGHPNLATPASEAPGPGAGAPPSGE